MTASLAHAAQGNHNNNSSTRSTSNSSSNTVKSKPPAGYMSTRSAAMMALALGQTSGGRSDKSPQAPRAASPAQSQAQSQSQSQSQSPHPGATRRLSNASSLPSNVSRSKPSTPTATRAAAQLNGSVSSPAAAIPAAPTTMDSVRPAPRLPLLCVVYISRADAALRTRSMPRPRRRLL